jgi:hypothetical protein
VTEDTITVLVASYAELEATEDEATEDAITVLMTS